MVSVAHVFNLAKEPCSSCAAVEAGAFLRFKIPDHRIKREDRYMQGLFGSRTGL